MHRTLSVLIWLSQRPHTDIFPSPSRLPAAGPRHVEESPSCLATTAGETSPSLGQGDAAPFPLSPAGLPALRYSGAGPGGTFRALAGRFSLFPAGPGRAWLAPPAISLTDAPPAFPRPSPWRRAGPAWRWAGGALGGSHLPPPPASGSRCALQPRCWVELAGGTRVLPAPSTSALVAPGARA